MKLRVLTAALIVLALCVPVCAVAAGKSTVDPNVGGSNVSDAKLAQKVTYEARRQTILTVLADLGKMAGVTLKAGRNNEDWQVRDRKINVFAKDISLADLMSSIGRVTKLKWSEGEVDYSYRLVADARTMAQAGTVLDRLEWVCSLNWEKHGRVLEFRSRDWYGQIAAMKPEAK